MVEIADPDNLPGWVGKRVVWDDPAANFGRAIEKHDFGQAIGRPLEYQIGVPVAVEVAGADDIPVEFR